MAHKIFLYIIAAYVLTACSGGRPSAQAAGSEPEEKDTTARAAELVEAAPVYNTIDARSLGLKGEVQRVWTECYSTYDSGGELKEGSVASTRELTFDAWGHVTRDAWGNEYGYDADGNYYRGNHVYTVVKRDKAGRLQQYTDVEPDADNEANQTLTFEYDKSGRLATIACDGWTGHWTEKRSYQSGNIYPTKVDTTADYEGGGTSASTTSYTYTRFDEHGNWTERTCVTSVKETEEDPWSESGEKTSVTETITIEKRTIRYYE